MGAQASREGAHASQEGASSLTRSRILAGTGSFCIYFGQSFNLDGLSANNPSGAEYVLGALGGELSADSASSGDTIARGTWAVTAPERRWTEQSSQAPTGSIREKPLLDRR
jgi:hypothetical protein